MEAAIKDGDFALNAAGQPLFLDGADAWFQRAAFRLRAKRGAFAYDPALGSRLKDLDLTGTEGETLARTAAAEALAPVPGARVASVRLEEGRVWVTVGIGEETREIEVKTV